MNSRGKLNSIILRIQILTNRITDLSRLNSFCNRCDFVFFPRPTIQTINQFLNILGPELRSVIKDMIGLDVMISRVKSLYKVFDAIDFDLFCEDNVENWNLFLKEFNLEVLRVEEECKLFIDWCFNNLS